MTRLKNILAVFLLATPLTAEDIQVGITADQASVTVETENGAVEIRRVQDTDHTVDADWAKTSRPCPSFCIQPMVPAPGVTTIGELELLDMLQNPDEMVIDSRTYEWFQKGAIPGAVSIPYTYIIDELARLGCEPDFEGWDCANAKRVALYCNGVWCGQSPTAIKAMVAEGYPADRIFYYRGGMQSWKLLGLTTTHD